MNLDDITPLILTWNEAPNIGRTLAGLRWAKRVVILDSGSTDETRQIAAGFSNVDWQHRTFDNHAAQCNYALDHLVSDSPWVLSMDADYQVTAAVVTELAAMPVTDEVSGVRARFTYCMDGRPLRGGLYPPRVVLYRPSRAHYVQEGHTQIVQISGNVLDLASKLLHDDRKPVARFMRNQRRYSALEARWLSSKRWKDLRWSGRARRLLVVAPWLAPMMVLLVRGGILDGRAGFRYAAERGYAETMVAWELIKRMASGSKA